MAKYKFEVKYRSPPVMNAQEGETVISENIYCDEVKYPHDHVTSSGDEKNYIPPVEFIEQEVEEDDDNDYIIKLSVQWENFISAKKV